MRRNKRSLGSLAASLLLAAALLVPAAVPGAAAGGNIAVRGQTVYTMKGAPIPGGLVLIRDGRIRSVTKGGKVPDGYRLLEAKVVTPGLIDAHSVIGFSGVLNQNHDQEQVERSAPIQPELRAIDAYNPRDPLVDYVRGFGVTTLHTGHSPGALVSGQTLIVKTHPDRLEKALVTPAAMIAASIGSSALSAKSPGTTPKAVSLLRAELIKASDYRRKQSVKDATKRPARDLRLEALGRALDGSQPLLVTADRHQDILAVLRVAAEFKLRVVLDGVADAPLVLDEIKRSGFPVVLHPSMARPNGDAENLSFETASQLRKAGVPFALQSGFGSYVPKTRVVLFEAAVAAANGLTFEQALASITVDAARLLGVDKRIGSLEDGKDADLALYDGDPFEYTTHCVGVIVNGVLVAAEPQ
jgi:imidazolonepropionase-like amidohydrolase